MNATKILWGQILLVSAVVLGLRLGGDGMDGLAPRLPAAARATLVRAVRTGRSTSRRPSSGGGSPTTPMRPISSSRAATSRPPAESPPSSWPSPCRSGAPARPSGSRPTARRGGPRPARSATPAFFGDDGVLLGRWRGDYLRHDGPEHVLCFAPTRSGKGVGLVVPTLLTWPGSAIVHDIKGENWTLTAGWRARFGRVLLFDPTNAAERRLQSAAGSPPRRMGSARRPEHRRRAGRSRRRAGEAQPLGEDQPLAAGRRDPACALRRAGQDAGRRRQLPVRSEAADRDDAAGDDDDAASWRERRASGRRQRGARAPEQERERALGRAVDRHVVPRPLSRSRGRGRHAPVRLAHPRSRRGRSTRARSTWSCRLPTSAAPSRWSA